MTINHFICPHCGHDFFDDRHLEVICDACGKKFHVSESLTSHPKKAAEQQAEFHKSLSQVSR